MKIMHNKYIKGLLLLTIIIITNVLIVRFLNFNIGRNITFKYTVKASQKDIHQVFLGNEKEWSEQNSVKAEYSNPNYNQILSYKIPKDINDIRVDLGNKEGIVELSDIYINYFGKQISIDDCIINSSKTNCIESFSKVEDNIKVKVVGNDPFIAIDLSSIDRGNIFAIDKYFNYILKAIMCIIFAIIILGTSKKRNVIYSLINEVYRNRTLLWSLAKNDFKTKYSGSYLGITWAFIQPIVTILVYWFVFEFGLKAGSPIKGAPFILWFMAGLVPWFFFQEALLNATNCMLEYSYLVKKVVFKISILPIVKIISAVFVHLVFIGFLFIVAGIYGFYPSLYTIQLIYYSFCTFFMVLGISYATSAIVIFFKDLGQLINIFLQVGMWMTPIMWSYTMVPERYQWVLKLSPMYYIVEGYRDTFINHVWFFQRYSQTAYFWVVTLGLFVLGAIIFKKLKAHFADVL